MKSLFVFFTLALSLSALAQNHMVEFKADSLLLGSFTYSKSSSDAETNRGSLSFNFARSVSEHIQVGVQGNYERNKQVFSKTETYSGLVGAIYNFDKDFRDTYYLSLFAGMAWRNYSGQGSVYSEYFTPKAAFGKRIPLTRFNLENLTYTPEVSYQYLTNTETGRWTQSVSIKFLQFSLFW